MAFLHRFREIDHPANKDDARTIYDRSHFAQAELFKLIVSLATGALAVYFLALTGDRVVVDGCQQIPALVALTSMGIAVLAGLVGWFSESQRQFFWALAKSTKEDDWCKTYVDRRDRAYRRTTVAMILLNIFFSVGIAASVGYIAMRILGWDCAT